jgi:hypothetical protein
LKIKWAKVIKLRKNIQKKAESKGQRAEGREQRAEGRKSTRLPGGLPIKGTKAGRQG